MAQRVMMRSQDGLSSTAYGDTTRYKASPEDRKVIEHIFGRLPADLDIDHIYSQAKAYG